MQTQRIHHLQHVPFETLGNIQDWIDENNYQQTSTHLYKNETLPTIDSFDVLIVLGGPMSVNDENEIAWLKQEKAFVKQAIEQEKIVVGICLGAQLIADVLGAKVYKNQQKEIGFFPVKSTAITNEIRATQSNEPPVILSTPPVILSEAKNLSTSLSTLLHNQTVFHWHGETFDLPENTIHLLTSEACKNQAFLYKEKVLGLQFHIEMNEIAINNIIENCRNELIVSDFVQSEETIKNEMKMHIAENKKLLFELLDILSKL